MQKVVTRSSALHQPRFPETALEQLQEIALFSHASQVPEVKTRALHLEYPCHVP